MKFEFAGRTYALDFTRKKQEVTIVRDGKSQTIQSKYPYTTVILYEKTTGAPVVVNKATVGCIPSDTYSNEKGRLAALKDLTEILRRSQYPEEFRRAMWNAYTNRRKQEQRVVEGEVVGAQKLLPAAPEASA